MILKTINQLLTSGYKKNVNKIKKISITTTRTICECSKVFPIDSAIISYCLLFLFHQL